VSTADSRALAPSFQETLENASQFRLPSTDHITSMIETLETSDVMQDIKGPASATGKKVLDDATVREKE
jgi:hypothetical protein